jgi:SAM-dependent methyltransferase
MTHHKIVEHYEDCFAKHGPNHLGVDWPNQRDLETRFKVMTDVILRQHYPCTLLDFGCGAGLLYKWITDKWFCPAVTYVGCDMSHKFIDFCKIEYPDTPFHQIDVIKNPESLPSFDYAIMNGVFTMRVGLSYDEMWSNFTQILTSIYQKATRGVAFNLMSKHVDWERDDLFHVPFDVLAQFLTKNLSRHFVIRNDYGLYEYTVYLYKEPNNESRS